MFEVRKNWNQSKYIQAPFRFQWIHVSILEQRSSIWWIDTPNNWFFSMRDMAILNLILFCLKDTADSQHFTGYKLCPSSSWHLFILLGSGIYIVTAKKEKDCMSVQFYVQVHRWCIVHKTTQTLKIALARCNLLNLRSQTPQKTSLSLLT